MLTREKLIDKRDEYKSEWLRLLQQAAAHEGAMAALDDLIAHFDDEEKPALTVDGLAQMVGE